MRRRSQLIAVAIATVMLVLALTQSRRTRTSVPVLVETPAAAPKGPAKRRAPRAPPGLTKPSPKTCLAPPEVEGEAGVAASEGLAYDDARAALNTFAPELVSCLGPGESPTGALLLRITVACTGLVDRAVVADRGDWSAEAAACVTDRLAYAEFPAHGLPDGDVVDWPLRYTPP